LSLIHLLLQTNQVNQGIVPIESNCEETEDACDHDFLLKDDFRHCVPYLWSDPAAHREYFLALMEKGVEFLVLISLINSLFVGIHKLIKIPIVFLYYFNLGFLPIAILLVNVERNN